MIIRHRKNKQSVLGAFWLGCLVLVAVIMLYGVVRYPYAPIRYRDGGYFDKVGNQFTEPEFRSFIIWQRCLFGAFGLTGLVSIPLALTMRRKRKP